MSEVKIKVFVTKAGKTATFSKAGNSYTLNFKATATHAEIEAAVKKELNPGEKQNG